MQYEVSQTIVSGNLGSEPVDVKWYTGESLAMAMGAMANAAANHVDADERVPEEFRTHVLDVTLTFLADCPWRDEPRTKRPSWAKAACAGREVETEVGILCATHHEAMRRADDIVEAEHAKTLFVSEQSDIDDGEGSDL